MVEIEVPFILTGVCGATISRRFHILNVSKQFTQQPIYPKLTGPLVLTTDGPCHYQVLAVFHHIHYNRALVT
jgi:hypothetical protein